MGKFVTNAEMSLNLLRYLMEKDGTPLTKDQEDHFNKRYAPILDKLDNDLDDSLGLPRLTETKEPPCDQ